MHVPAKLHLVTMDLNLKSGVGELTKRSVLRWREQLSWGMFVMSLLLVPAACTGQIRSEQTAHPSGTVPGVESSTHTSELGSTGRWTPLSSAPLSNRSGFTSVWTGRELLVCCGADKSGGDTTGGPALAAAYNPSTGTWRSVAGPPDPVESWGAISVAGDTIYFLDGGTSPWANAAYDITSDSWREVPAPPLNATRTPSSRLGPSAWTGKEIIAPISTPPASEHDLVMVAFEPASNTWRTLPSPPSRLEPTSLIHHDNSLTLLGEQRNPADQGGALISETFDLTTNTWSEPERTPVDRRGPQVEGNGERVVTWDVSGSVRVKSNGAWRELPKVPFPEDECGWKGTQLGNKLVLWRCTQQGAVLDLDTERWASLPKPPEELSDSNIVVVDGELLLWAMSSPLLQAYALDLGDRSSADTGTVDTTTRRDS